MKFTLTLIVLVSLSLFVLFDKSLALDRKGDVKGTILVLGDSIAAGYGIDPESAFPALLQQKIEQDDFPYRVVNAGLSGETSAGGVRRIDWLLKQDVDILILELGGNDGLRGLDLNITYENLKEIITKTRERFPDVKILVAGMKVPPNLGRDYTERFAKLYSDLAEETESVLVPFILEGVGGVARLNLADGIHPNVEGQKIVAENIWRELKGLLEDGELR